MRLCQHSHGRGGTIYFCLRKLGHDGDHRGSGAQWTKRGARVAANPYPVLQRRSS